MYWSKKITLAKTTSFRHNERDAENIEKAKGYLFDDRANYLSRKQITKGDAIRYALRELVKAREALKEAEAQQAE